jgi:hypothetical protein
VGQIVLKIYEFLDQATTVLAIRVFLINRETTNRDTTGKDKPQTHMGIVHKRKSESSAVRHHLPYLLNAVNIFFIPRTWITPSLLGN